MSYVFSKALTERDADERLKKQLPLPQSAVPFNVPPPVKSRPEVPSKPGTVPPPVANRPRSASVPGTTSNDATGEQIENDAKPPIANKPTHRPPPRVMRKPLVKSLSVDTGYSARDHGADLTQIGDSQWKDFVLNRQKEQQAEESNVERRTSTVGETIPEDEELSLKPKTNTRDAHAPPKIVDGEWENSATRSNDDVMPLDLSRRLSDLKTNDASQIENGEWMKARESTHTDSEIVNSKKHLVTNSDGTNIEKSNTDSNDSPESLLNLDQPTSPEHVNNNENDEVVASVSPTTTTSTEPTTLPNTEPSHVALPKPRNIGSELKRKAFGGKRSMSLPAITGLAMASFATSTSSGSPRVIKRSSDILKETGENQSFTFDTQLPYFARRSRGSSIDSQEALGDAMRCDAMTLAEAVEEEE